MENKLNDYEYSTIKFPELKGKVALPKYQRNVVWKFNQKQEFIESVRKGYPFGIILLYKNKKTNKYEIIDGLQRYSTLCNFQKERKQYLPKNFLDEIIIQLKDSYGELHEESLDMDAIENFKTQVYETFNVCSDKDKYVESLFSRLSCYEKKYCKEEDLRAICEMVFDEFDDYLNLEDLNIPILIYKGDESNLPTIFEKINTTGTKLSSFDVYAAMWSKYTYTIRDYDILNEVEARYLDIIKNANLDISNFEEDDIKSSQKINLYEYCYAFSKYLCSKSKIIPKKGDSTIGFYLMHACLGGDMTKINQLPSLLIKYDFPDEPDIFNSSMMELKQKILDTILSVERIFYKYFKLEKLDSFIYNEHQFITIIATAFKLKYKKVDGLKVLKYEKNYKNEELYKSFERNLPFVYFYEQIDGYWNGNFCNFINDNLNRPLSNNQYCKKVIKGNMENALNEWLKKEKEKETLTAISSKTKLFMVFLANLRKASSSNDLVIDFIIPKKILQENGITRVSATANVGIFPKFKERNRMTYLDYNPYANEIFLNCFLYPSSDDLNFVKKQLTLGTYKSFCDKRIALLKSTFLDYVSKNNNENFSIDNYE